MCYTKDASIFSFAVNVVSSGVLFTMSPTLGAFYFFVGLMQLYDYVFWTYPGTNRINGAVTKLAMVSNHLQPIVLALLVHAYVRRLTLLSLVVVWTYVAVASVYTLAHWSDVHYTNVHPKSYPSLYWEWNDKPGAQLLYALFVATLVVLFGLNFKAPLNVVLAGLAVASFALSWYYYKGKTAVGRFWCYFAAFLPMFVSVLLLVQKR